MITKIISALVLSLALIVGSASALTTTVTGTLVAVQYTEPSTNRTGTPLADLRETTVWYRLGPTAARVLCVTVPASSVSGGRDVTTSCLVPVLEDQESDVQVTVTATDISGNESVESAPVVQRIDRLAPSAPF